MTFRTKKTFVIAFQKSTTGLDTSIGLALSENYTPPFSSKTCRGFWENDLATQNGQIEPTCNSSDVCGFFRRLSETLCVKPIDKRVKTRQACKTDCFKEKQPLVLKNRMLLPLKSQKWLSKHKSATSITDSRC